MSDASEIFFTSIGCMDGRALRPVRKFGKKKFGVWYVDTITEAGLVGQFAKENDPQLLESVKKKLLISLEKHYSKGVIVHGHEDCTGNPVSDDQHKEDILKSAEIIGRFAPEEIEIVPAFVVKKNGDWEVEVLA